MAGWADVPGATDPEKEHARLAIGLLRRLINDSDVFIESSNKVEGQWIYADLHAFDISDEEAELLRALRDGV